MALEQQILQLNKFIEQANAEDRDRQFSALLTRVTRISWTPEDIWAV